MREFGTPTRSNRDPGKPTLYVPIGIPASGKSTWATKQRDQIICPDTYRRTVYGGVPTDGLITDHEKEVWRWAYSQLDLAQRERHSLVFDATNLSQSRRTRLRNLAQRHNHVAVYFDTPLELCLARNAEREYPVPSQVVESMHERLVPPTHDENWDDVWVLKPPIS